MAPGRHRPPRLWPGPEQARGITQVNQAITQMDKVTQSTAANAEESSAASEELSSQAQELAAMGGAFRLDHTVRRLPVPRRS